MATITKITKNGTTYDVGISEDQRRLLQALPYYTSVYGVMWDTADPSPECYRIGNMMLHATLPIQNQMLGGVLTDDGTFTEFDNQQDWTQATQPRDGSAGQVMVSIPEFWILHKIYGTINILLLSTAAIDEFTHIPANTYYISAYEASLQRSTLKLSSVVSRSTDYRGGNNTAAWDNTYRDLLGRPATNINLTNFRNYARNRGTAWNGGTYTQQKLLYWLFVVEYATLNTQKEFNAQKTAEGYMQGGLGDGVTGWTGDSWNTWNGYNPFIECGYTDEYGSSTAQKNYTITDSNGNALKTFAVCRYRGIENIFAHIWKWTDGILVDVQAADAGGRNMVYITADPAKFNSTDYSQYTYLCDQARTANFIKKIVYGTGGDIICTETPGSSTTYYCDWNHGSTIPASGSSLRGVLFGGFAHYAGRAGFLYAASNNVPGHASPHIGARLSYIRSA